MSARKRTPLLILAGAAIFLSGAAVYLYLEKAVPAATEAKVAILLSQSDEISFYVNIESKPDQQKAAIEVLRGLVRNGFSSFGCGPFDEENLEIAPSEARVGYLDIGYSAFHCESEPFEDLAYELELKPFKSLFSLSETAQVSISVARVNQAESDLGCIVDGNEGCDFLIERDAPFPGQLSIDLKDGESFALRARSRKPIEIACEHLSVEELIGERFLDIQHALSEQTHIMRDDALSMKHGKICGQQLLLSLKREEETGLDFIQDALILPALSDEQTLTENCWNNPEEIPVPGLLGIIASGKGEKAIEALQAWDLSLASGQIFAVRAKVTCRETLPSDSDAIWGEARNPLASSQLRVAKKAEKLPPALEKSYPSLDVMVWEIDLDGDKRPEFIVQDKKGQGAKTCLHSREGKSKNCSWLVGETGGESSRYLWFAQLDEDPLLELIEMSSLDDLLQYRIYKIDPLSWELKKQFDFNPLIEGNFKDKHGLFFAYASDVSDILIEKGQMKASFWPELYRGHERLGPFIVFRGIPSQGNEAEIEELQNMSFNEVLASHEEALKQKLYEQDKAQPESE